MENTLDRLIYNDTDTLTISANTLTKVAEYAVSELCLVTAIFDFSGTGGFQQVRIFVDGNEWAGDSRSADAHLMTVTALCNPTAKVEIYVKPSTAQTSRPFRCIITKG